jgi:chromosome segregation ATPase
MDRVKGFVRKLLLWVIGLAVVFGLGVGVAWFTLVRDIRTENNDLQSQVSTLEAERATIEESVRADCDAKIADIQAQADEANLHVQLVNALVDVSSARVALGQDDLVGIRAALAGTDDRLASLQAGLGADGTTAVQALRDQLKDLLDNLGQDPLSLDQDLERLTANLLALERSLFSE